jgi:GT2 family glycosyltransferase
MTDIIIPVWNQLAHTRSCIGQILACTRVPFRLILIDNGSDRDTCAYLEELAREDGGRTTLIRNRENLGFVKAANQGLRASRAPYACILNNDTVPGEGWLVELTGFAERHPDAGLLNPLCNGHLQRNMTVNEYARHVAVSGRGRYMEMNQCQGFCMLIKRAVIDRIGCLDEQFGIGGFDDTDYSMRAHRAGFRSVCVYSSYVYHQEHASFDTMGNRKKLQKESERRYFEKWPRHRRAAILYSVSKNTRNEEIGHFLEFALALARSWHWVNCLVFGGRNARSRVETVMAGVRFPLHQNIKFNYLSRHFRLIEIVARILERSIGRKRRKKYDSIVCDEKKLMPLLKMLCAVQGCAVLPADFRTFPGEVANGMTASAKIRSNEKPKEV